MPARAPHELAVWSEPAINILLCDIVKGTGLDPHRLGSFSCFMGNGKTEPAFHDFTVVFVVPILAEG